MVGGYVRLSSVDKSVDLDVPRVRHGSVCTPAQISGCKGFRSIRATHGVCEGDWYFEAEVMEARTGSEKRAVRVGWSTRRANVEGPVGRDVHGFGLRDRNGEFVHKARLEEYGEPFGAGDVIGCRIQLPATIDTDLKNSLLQADKEWLEYVVEGYAKQRSGILPVSPPQEELVMLRDTAVYFLTNGLELGLPTPLWNVDAIEGEPWHGINAGVYYPTVSVYDGGRVTVNFGPDFKHEIPKGSRPFCECV